jgi:tetratricopeptide (TPR) repeat protein
LNAARDAGDREKQGMILHNLSIAYGGLGQFERAIQTDEEALTIARELDDQEGVGLSLIHLAELYCDQGRYPEAIDRARDGGRIGADLKNPEIGSISGYVQALAQLFTGNLTAAQDAAEVAHRYQYPANDHNVLAALGTVYIRQGKIEPAREAFRGVLAIRDAGEMESQDLLDACGLALCGLVLCGEDARVDEAVTAYQQAREASPDSGVKTRAQRLFDALAAADSESRLARVVGVWAN